MSMRNPCRRTRGFTLIELLVVITIIGILAGLAFPAITGAMNAARKAEAGAMISQLRTSLSSYQTEYGVYPKALRDDAGAADKKAIGKDIYFTLIAKDGGNNTAHADNLRRIIFMEFNAKVLRAGDAASGNKTAPADPSSADNFVDPWNQDYGLTADANYDNVITLPSPLTGTVNAGLIVWSPGAQKSTGFNGTGSPEKTKYICSWK